MPRLSQRTGNTKVALRIFLFNHYLLTAMFHATIHVHLMEIEHCARLFFFFLNSMSSNWTIQPMRRRMLKITKFGNALSYSGSYA